MAGLVRALGRVADDSDHAEARVGRAQFIRAEPEPPQGAGAAGGQEHVGVGKVVIEVGAAGGVLEVEPDDLLAFCEMLVPGGVGSLQRVSGGWFDLDDRRAQGAHSGGRGGPRHVLGQRYEPRPF